MARFSTKNNEDLRQSVLLTALQKHQGKFNKGMFDKEYAMQRDRVAGQLSQKLGIPKSKALAMIDAQQEYLESRGRIAPNIGLGAVAGGLAGAGILGLAHKAIKQPVSHALGIGAAVGGGVLGVAAGAYSVKKFLDAKKQLSQTGMSPNQLIKYKLGTNVSI